MSAVDLLKKRRTGERPEVAGERIDDPQQPDGAPRSLKLSDDEKKGLNPGEEVTLTVTGRLNPDGQLDVTSIQPGSVPTEPPEVNQSNPNNFIRPA